MPFYPLGEFAPSRPEPVSFSRITSGITYAAELVFGGGGHSVLRTQSFSIAEEEGWAIFGDGRAYFFGDLTIGANAIILGDVYSQNWDGSIPANLSATDQSATEGYYLDSSVGAAQFMGQLRIGNTPGMVLSNSPASGIDNSVEFYSSSAFELNRGRIDQFLNNPGASETVGLRIRPPGVTTDGSNVVRPSFEMRSEGADESVPALFIFEIVGTPQHTTVPPGIHIHDDVGGFYINENHVQPAYLFGGYVTYSADDTFDKADYPGLRAIIVELVGSGGGGGGAATSSAGNASGGSGGGSGSYAKSFILVADLAASEAVTVPAGGAGNSGAAGSNGADTIFDTISGEVRGKGGGGGGHMANGNTVSTLFGGVGGTASTGNILGGLNGQRAGTTTRTLNGSTIGVTPGAPSHFAGGGPFGLENNGSAGTHGSGGGGCRQAGVAGSARTGGAGGDGFVLVTLLY